ncbi:hypothetical protein G8S49_11465 [Clostridium botulinum C]|uniref:Uncharacterized protein n=3 Tax=Clostridium botulinum TaxID=1491 RepID=A0A9N7B418_CLOBO|nr:MULTISPECIES: hypothetical protein [Clostridium]KMJ93062.1 hypothetical protein CBCST_p3CbCSt0026 [Clostridium botulinum C str. Stockholm]ACT33710.1 hypothetical protein CLG_A0027 [Clostridium botulinum D str. 1873]AYF55394.1 hypothetical protein DFH04_11720 [Clostridium novyi]AYF55434.1 hypothetical protein DFH04_11970 [Clostridium novyi]MBO3442143.1 hypothetical protein [Clostridium haemolyticum]
MFPNIKCCCCRQGVNANEYFYVEVKNETTHYLNFILSYYYFSDKETVKPSPPFGPGKSERMAFPGGVEDLILNVYDSYFNPPYLICFGGPPNKAISRYKVVQHSLDDFECIKY